MRGATSFDLALRERVDFVVIAGDVFEVASPTLLGQTRFRDGLSRLADAGIPSFVVHGNHDPADGRSWAPSLAFPALVHRFGTEAGESVPVLRDGREIARIHGRSYPRAAVTENFAASMRAEADAPFSIGLLHTNVGDRPGHANYAPCSLDDLRVSGMDYWALGHIHQPGQVLADPPAFYSGIPQGRDPGELGARGCYLVEVDAARRVSADLRRHRRRALASARTVDRGPDRRRVPRPSHPRARSGRPSTTPMAARSSSGSGSTGAARCTPRSRRPGYLDDLAPAAQRGAGRLATVRVGRVDPRRHAAGRSTSTRDGRPPTSSATSCARSAAARRSDRTHRPGGARAVARPCCDRRSRRSSTSRRAVAGTSRAAARATDALVGELLDEAEALGIDLLARRRRGPLMRIERIEIDGFGRFHDDDWDAAAGLTVLLGANEAGKTTLLNALRALLFGFEPTPRRTRLVPRPRRRPARRPARPPRPRTGRAGWSSATGSAAAPARWRFARRTATRVGRRPSIGCCTAPTGTSSRTSSPSASASSQTFSQPVAPTACAAGSTARARPRRDERRRSRASAAAATWTRPGCRAGASGP